MTGVGEPEDLCKSQQKDPFLLSSCLLTEAQDKVMALVIGALQFAVHCVRTYVLFIARHWSLFSVG